jgi:hypothetical protein
VIYTDFLLGQRGRHYILSSFELSQRGRHKVSYEPFESALRGRHSVFKGFALSERGRYRMTIPCTLSARGMNRVANDALDRYGLFRGVNAEPDLSATASPWATSATLPITTSALSAGNTYYFVLRKQNRWGIWSQNVASFRLELDGSGNEVAIPPSDPTAIAIEPAAAGTARVSAFYDYAADGINAADTWLIYLTSDGSDPDPLTDTPIEVPMVVNFGAAGLAYTTSAFSEGATVKVIVRTRRCGTPDVDSVGTDIYSTTVTLLGPAAPGHPGAFLGTSYQQTQ